VESSGRNSVLSIFKENKKTWKTNIFFLFYVPFSPFYYIWAS